MLLQDGHAARHPAEDGVATIQVWLWTQGDEPLAAAGIGTGERHPHVVGAVATEVELIANGLSRTAPAIAARITSLHHEVRHDAVIALAVKVVRLHESHEAGDRRRRLRPEQLHLERAELIHLDRHRGIALGVEAGLKPPHDVAIVVHAATRVQRVCATPGLRGQRPVLLGPAQNDVVLRGSELRQRQALSLL